MKIKGKTGFSIKNTGIISLALYSLLMIVRLYQTFFCIDGETGFFIKSDITVGLMYILVIAGVPLICALCYISGDSVRGGLVKKSGYFSAAAGILFAVTLLFTGAKDNFAAIKELLQFLAEEEKITVPVIKESFGGWLGLLSAYFAFAGGIVILIESIITARGKELPSYMKLPMLIPVLWAFAETLSFFSVTVSYVKVSQLLLTIFSLAFTMLFLFENARISSDIGKKDAMWFFYASGIIAAGLSFAAGIPYFFASLFSPDKIVSYCPLEIYTVAGGLYALTCMIKRSGKEENTSDEAVVSEIE